MDDIYLTTVTPDYTGYMTRDDVEAKKIKLQYLQKRFVQGTFKAKGEKAYQAARTRFEDMRKGKVKAFTEQRYEEGTKRYARLRVVLAQKFGMDKCAICGQGPRKDFGVRQGDGLEIHHIVSLAYGGANVLENFILLCAECHTGAGGVHSGLPADLD